MRYVALSNARSRLTDLVDSAERTVITKNGAPAAVLLNVDDYRALQTSANLAKDPQHLLEVLEGHEAVQRGDHGDFVEFSEGVSLQRLVDEVEEEDREAEEGLTAHVTGLVIDADILSSVESGEEEESGFVIHEMRRPGQSRALVETPHKTRSGVIGRASRELSRKVKYLRIGDLKLRVGLKEDEGLESALGEEAHEEPDPPAPRTDVGDR